MAETAHATHVHAAPTGFIRKYVFSLDHKVIGIQYYFLALFSVVVGMILSIFIRFNLVWPGTEIPLLETFFPVGAPGGVMTPEFYLSFLTMHGTIMVFMVLTTAPQSGFGNYFLPIQIGAADMAFPTLNMLSFWFTFLSLVILMAAFFVTGGPPISGWTGYPPLSALGEIAGPGLGMGQNLWILAIAVFCIAAMLGSINFITTTLDLRTEGMSLMRMPLTCWSWFITAILGLLAFGVLLAAGVLLLMDRMAGSSFFIPGGLVVSDQIIDHKGGSPLLWQHLFWFFGHPEVYIAILPGMGITSHILSTFSRKPIFGYKAMVYAMLAIGILGFMVWGHHMFMSGMSPYTAIFFALMTTFIAVPSAIKTFNWLGTIWRGNLRLTTAMLFALGFVSLFVSGGVDGLFLNQPSTDIYLHDTYFVVAHFHLIMGVAAIFGIFGGTYFWFPKMFGRHLNESLGKIHFWITFVGAYCIFMPMHFVGMMGNPRRYAEFTAFDFLEQVRPLHLFITIAALITIAAQLLFLANFFWSLFKGKKAAVNPWEATNIEWEIPHPLPHDNFEGRLPVVHHGPYEYSVPGHPTDFTMQTAQKSPAKK